VLPELAFVLPELAFVLLELGLCCLSLALCCLSLHLCCQSLYGVRQVLDNSGMRLVSDQTKLLAHGLVVLCIGLHGRGHAVDSVIEDLKIWSRGCCHCDG
jgi:hypothetical protein